MNKKGIIYILIIILIMLVAIIGVMGYFHNHIKVGDAYFTLPEGYKCVANGEYTNITNDNNEYIILDYNNTNDLKKVINDYVKYNEDHNLSLSLYNITIGEYTVYKSIMNNDTQIVHYWFIYNDQTYQIYTRSANSNSEKIISDLISSVKTAPI